MLNTQSMAEVQHKTAEKSFDSSVYVHVLDLLHEEKI